MQGPIFRKGQTRSNRLTGCRKESTLSDAELEALGQNALKEREALLEKYPHLNGLQKNIDRILMGAGSFDNRMTALGLMMEANLKELQKHLAHLSAVSGKLSNI
jgi:hypothetical protein